MSTQDEPVLIRGASVFRMAGWRIASRNLAVVLAAIVVVVMVAVRAAVATMAAVREHHYRICGKRQFRDGLLRCRLHRGRRSAAQRGDLFLEFADPLQFGQLNSRGLPAFGCFARQPLALATIEAGARRRISRYAGCAHRLWAGRIGEKRMPVAIHAPVDVGAHWGACNEACDGGKPQDHPTLTHCAAMPRPTIKKRSSEGTASGYNCLFPSWRRLKRGAAIYLQSVMQRTDLVSGRSSMTKPSRLGICTFGMLLASITASAGTRPSMMRPGSWLVGGIASGAGQRCPRAVKSICAARFGARKACVVG
jgi:hypothetical protein